MLYTAIAIFALAAILGLLILKNWFTNSKTPRSVIYGHGLFAAIGLVLLLLYMMRSPSNMVTSSLILFAATAIVGFYMFFRDMKGKFSPMWLAVVHGLTAAGALVILLFMVM